MQVRTGDYTWVTQALGMPQLGRGWGDGEARTEQDHPTCWGELLCSSQLTVRCCPVCDACSLGQRLSMEHGSVCWGLRVLTAVGFPGGEGRVRPETPPTGMRLIT